MLCFGYRNLYMGATNMFRAIKGIFTHPQGGSSDAIQKVNDALEAKYTSSALKNLSDDKLASPETQSEERRTENNDRRQHGDRRKMPDRRVQNKFVLINRRKNNGRRILSRGRRYVPDRRATG